jgi:hypothetical protein
VETQPVDLSLGFRSKGHPGPQKVQVTGRSCRVNGSEVTACAGAASQIFDPSTFLTCTHCAYEPFDLPYLNGGDPRSCPLSDRKNRVRSGSLCDWIKMK